MSEDLIIKHCSPTLAGIKTANLFNCPYSSRLECECDVGYHSHDAARCIRELRHRLKDSTEFPHEIGLFLGYPPEDVRGFILHKGNCCKYSGCWKVYGNEEKAAKEFAKFKKCSDIYYSKWLQGTPIQKLTVACN